MRSLTILSFVSAVAASSSHTPLVRRTPSSRIYSPHELAARLQAVDAKYGRLNRKRQSNSGVPMVNQAADSSYYSPMKLGTPPTAYGVVLDTGSSDLWFQTDTCTACTKGAKIQTSSSTLQQSTTPFSIRYGSGAVGGVLARDTVSMGGFTVQNQTMGLVNQTQGMLLSGQTAGLCGLAFQDIANTRAVPFWEALVSTNQWTEPLMSFWLTRYNNVTSAREEEYGGEFRMGGTNTTLYTGDIEYHDLPSTTKSYWMIPLRQITVNGGQPIVISNMGVTSLAAIDTGTTLIGGPSDVVASIYAQVPGAQRGAGDLARYWIYPCAQSVSMTFNFGGIAWPIQPADFFVLTDDPTKCVGAVYEANLGGAGNPDVPQWIVGDAFLKNVYSVFRYSPPSIGFAQLSPSISSGDIGQALPNQSTSTSGSLSSTSTSSGSPPTGLGTTPRPTTSNGTLKLKFSRFTGVVVFLIAAAIV